MAATDSTEDGRVPPSEPQPDDRQKRAIERREALLDAAEIVVRRVGPQVTAALIAAEAGVTKPIIYRHFGDIQDLYQALAIRMERRLSAWLIENRKRTASLDQRGRLQAVIGAFFEGVGSSPKLYQFLIYTGGGEPGQAGALSWFTRQWAGSVARYLALLRGEAEVSTASRATGYAMCGAIESAASWWLEDATVPVDEVVDAVVDMLLSGVPADLLRHIEPESCAEGPQAP